MLGSYMIREARAGGLNVKALARSGGDIIADLTSEHDLHRVLEDFKPEIIINCAGMVDLETCEHHKRSSWAINVEAVANLSSWAQRMRSKLIHVSTDQFISGLGRSASDEGCSQRILSTYAAHKFCGEHAALTSSRSLILRTAVTGATARLGKPSLWDWAHTAITQNKKVDLFYDAYTSLIDATTFCRAAIELILNDSVGIFNVGSTEVFSKKEFFLEIADQLNVEFLNYEDASVSSLVVPRNTSLGLDVNRAAKNLSFELPSLRQVVANLISEERNYK